MTVAVESTTQTYKLLSQGHTKPFTDTAFLFGHLVKLAQPIMTDYYSDLFHDAFWLREHAGTVQPTEVCTWHWYVSQSHTTIHLKAEPYAAYPDKHHYRFTLFLAEDGWWTLSVEHVAA